MSHIINSRPPQNRATTLQTKKITVTLFTAILSFVLASSVAMSSITSSLTIGTYGSIATALPLHVVGNRILNSNGSRVILKGVVYTYFMDSPDGSWLQSNGAIEWNTWDPAAINHYLDVMKTWNVNSITVFSTAEWWIRNTNNFQDHIKYFIQLASYRGIYVSLTWWAANATNAGWTNAGVYTGSSYENTAPFPPFDYNNIINGTSDIVNMWRDIANQLKSYPNVIFELWDEPKTQDPVIGPIWFSVFQQCITAIRGTGATNLIDICYGDTLNYDVGTDSSVGFSWVYQYPLNDTLNNLIYDQHHYMDTFYNTNIASYWSYSYEASSYADILTGFNKTGTLTLAQTKPVFIGEIGCSNYRANQTMEQTAYNNTMNVLDAYGIGYNVFASPPWVSGTEWALVVAWTDYTPTTPGQILIDKLGGTISQPIPQAFGDTNIETGIDDIPANYKQVCLFQAPKDGIITKLTYYCSQASSSTRIKAIVYADQSGSPVALLGQGVEITPPTSLSWIDLTGLNVQVTAGTYYWLGVIVGGGTVNDRLVWSGNGGAYNVDAYSDGASNPFGTSIPVAVFTMSIYATYST